MIDRDKELQGKLQRDIKVWETLQRHAPQRPVQKRLDRLRLIKEAVDERLRQA